ncbi:glycosyl hydrolase family 95 catalytic domain-containing protein [Compostimonas suwonensis]|uniref:Glycosyl hydrolase family 95 catalytic domain-containing protein n=1 Tax=Compostimonas suwonensis TaxID=1048394 RepID=A0A2M9C555_9MICO|nr:hypothetical protein [Compostimonas suwonensis]PJJ65629.1 hypothetical protein CLV54_0666 [Compostimonas suwonensis]
MNPSPRSREITWSGPSPRFLDSALLGNGGLGVALSTRPDAIVLHLAHNDVWDRRIDESHRDEILSFDEVFARVEAIDPNIAAIEDDPWFAGYRARMVAAYAKPYPRPLACGSLILGFEPRDVQVVGTRLDVLTGLCRVDLVDRGTAVTVEVFVDQDDDDVHLRCTTPEGEPAAAPFTRVRMMADPDGPAPEQSDAAGGPTTFILPRPGDVPMRDSVTELELGANALGFTETLPALGPGAEADGAIDARLAASTRLARSPRRDWYGNEVEPAFGERYLERIEPGEPFWAVLEFRHSYGHGAVVPGASAPSARPAPGPELWSDARQRSEREWDAYWGRSHIELSDDYLESVWYRNTYFAHCAVREGSSAPGLFGNWIFRDIGAAWHGDYHMNYNAQQTYWGSFASNRVEQHLPYVDLVERLAPVARGWAGDYYGMRGAAYPHSAYNAPMTVNPYPNPVWAWELSESPWTVQSLWWHFQYTRDLDYLRDRALPLIRDVVLFLVDYLSRPQTTRRADGLIHIFPTVAPELYGLAPGLSRNSDCLLDIALIRFVFDAFARSCDELGLDGADAQLRTEAERILAALPDYPTAQTPDGPVFVSIPGEPADTVYNVPIPGMTVFPGEQHSWESDPQTIDTLTRSIRRQRLEGGNELVFANLQAARLGILDLERFTRQLRYCELGNGTFTDMALQVHGRYNDATDFEFMEKKGVWVENFALTAVINELLLQSYSGTVRLFPNCEGLSHARFSTLRAPGAFLLSAELAEGVVSDIRIHSEAGEQLRILIPWESGAVLTGDTRRETLSAGIVTIPTAPGEDLVLREFKPLG